MLSENLVEFVFEAEKNDSRFEKFCADLSSVNEGMSFVTTSATWDRGRDARAVAASQGTHPAIICATLNRRLDAKATRDLARVASTSTPDRLIYCSSQKLSEHAADKLTQEIRKQFPSDTSIAVMGASELAQLSLRYPDVFQKHYSHEIGEFLKWLQPRDTGTDEERTRGLRLALLSFSGDKPTLIRDTATKRAVLDALFGISKGTTAEISLKLSRDLHLPRVLPPTYVFTILQELEATGLARDSDSRWELTDQGRTNVQSIPLDAAQDLARGRIIIRNELENLIGSRLSDDHFERVWSTLLDVLGVLFHSNGIGVIEGLSELLDPDVTISTTEQQTLHGLLLDGASRIRATTSNGELGETLEQAVLDIFTERQGRAFDWLSSVAERFVMLCAMGLEGTSAVEIRKVICHQLLVLDSDIILTFLCGAEPDHETALQMLKLWAQRGGRILLLTPVLEEVAHHAWIADRDFSEIRSFARKLHRAELRRYASNAFTRTFFASGVADLRRWPAFVGQYRGDTPDDFSRILEHLEDELPVERLTNTFDQSLQSRIAIELKQTLAFSRGVVAAELDERDNDKAERDGQGLATIAAARTRERRSGSGNSVLLVTSSTRLRRADAHFRTDLGRPPSVIPLGSVAYLLSLTPGSELGAGALRRALFNFGPAARLSDTDRVALRAIRATGQYTVPWAKRRTLQRELENVLHEEAQKLGVTDKSVQQKFRAANEEIRPAEIIAEALSRVAASDKLSEQVRQAEQTIRSSEEQIHLLQDELRRMRETAQKRKQGGSAKKSLR